MRQSVGRRVLARVPAKRGARPPAAAPAVPRGVALGLFVGIFLMIPGVQIAGAALLATGHHMAKFVRRVHSIGIGAYVVVVLLAIVSFAFSVLRVIFNVALLSSSFNAMAAIMSTDLPDMDEVAEALRDAVGPFASLVSFFVDIMRSLSSTNARTVRAVPWNPAWSDFRGDAQGLILVEM